MKRRLLLFTACLVLSTALQAQSGGGSSCVEPCAPGKFVGYDQHGSAIIRCGNLTNAPCVSLQTARSLSELKANWVGKVDIIGEGGTTVQTLDVVGYGGWKKEGSGSTILFTERKP